ncbi:unnamed protein product, partial [Sphacelaria rigidula]
AETLAQDPGGGRPSSLLRRNSFQLEYPVTPVAEAVVVRQDVNDASVGRKGTEGVPQNVPVTNLQNYTEAAGTAANGSNVGESPTEVSSSDNDLAGEAAMKPMVEPSKGHVSKSPDDGFHQHEENYGPFAEVHGGGLHGSYNRSNGA